MNNNFLKNYRNQIDIIDSWIVNLLRKRFEIVDEIGKIKKKEWIDIFQVERWNEVIDTLTNHAKKNNLDPNLLKKIWNLIHEESLKREK